MRSGVGLGPWDGVAMLVILSCPAVSAGQPLYTRQKPRFWAPAIAAKPQHWHTFSPRTAREAHIDET
jgi:hypothetical protein